MDFELLVNSIQQTHVALQQSAVKAINRHITIRNWLIGFYIFEYEQKGEDRAKYGQKLLPEISKAANIKGLSETNLKINRQFYLAYPQIGQTLSDFFKNNIQSGESLSAQLPLPAISQSVSDEFKPGHSIMPTEPAGALNTDLIIPPEKLISRLSFSHLTELLEVKDPLKRTFYELECIKGNWSVRELRRQINSLYFERSGLSQNPERLSAMIAENAEPLQAVDVIKSVYAFEFLGLKAKEVVEEGDLETALLDHLMEFLLEMGHGF